MTAKPTGGYAAAFAAGDAASLGARLLAQLPKGAAGGQQATLGILYVSEPAAQALPELVDELAAGTGIAQWTGGVGLGVCGAGEEVYDRPAAAMLTAALPEDAFRMGFGAEWFIRIGVPEGTVDEFFAGLK